MSLCTDWVIRQIKKRTDNAFIYCRKKRDLFLPLSLSLCCNAEEHKALKRPKSVMTMSV